MFVVTALHNTAHGEAATTFFITENLFWAVIAAKNAEKLGFEFHGESYIAVCHLAQDMVYEKKDFKSEADNPMIFFRNFNHREKQWEECWLDEKNKRLFEAAYINYGFAHLQNP